MACLNKIVVKVPDKEYNEKLHGSEAIKTKAVAVPCGKCAGCLESKRAQWSFRLIQEERAAKSSTFLTLTYSDKYLPKDGYLDKAELQRYWKKVRKVVGKDLKYFAVGEYGEKTKRPHYHAIVYNADNQTLADKWSEQGEPKGFVTTDTVTQASIHYVTGYIVNGQEHGYGYIKKKAKKPWAIMSKKLGINYAQRTGLYHKNSMVTEVQFPSGHKTALPRYFREKIFNSDDITKLSERNLEEATEKIKNMTSDDYDKHLVKNRNKRRKIKRSAKSNTLI